MKLLEYLNINIYAINLEKSEQLLYRQIYSIKLAELETFKTLIMINLANDYI